MFSFGCRANRFCASTKGKFRAARRDCWQALCMSQSAYRQSAWKWRRKKMRKETGFQSSDVNNGKIISMAAILVLYFVFAAPLAHAQTVYLDQASFNTAITNLGAPIAVGFDDLDAGPINSTVQGRTPFDGNSTADRGITFMSPAGFNLYISPGALPFNGGSNSLSVWRFPFDTMPNDSDNDTLVVELTIPSSAIGFTLVDNGPHSDTEFVQFLDINGAIIRQEPLPQSNSSNRSFIGITSPDRPIAKIYIAENPNDGDDIAYDDFTFTVTSTFDGKGQSPEVNAFLAYTGLIAKQTFLPVGTTTFPLAIFYSQSVRPDTFHAELNGADITSLFNPIPGRAQLIRINLKAGRNVLTLLIKGSLSSGGVATDKDRFVFNVQ
jgi:hypothetical protein